MACNARWEWTNRQAQYRNYIYGLWHGTNPYVRQCTFCGLTCYSQIIFLNDLFWLLIYSRAIDTSTSSAGLMYIQVLITNIPVESGLKFPRLRNIVYLNLGLGCSKGLVRSYTARMPRIDSLRYTQCLGSRHCACNSTFKNGALRQVSMKRLRIAPLFYSLCARVY